MLAADLVHHLCQQIILAAVGLLKQAYLAKVAKARRAFGRAAHGHHLVSRRHAPGDLDAQSDQDQHQRQPH